MKVVLISHTPDPEKLVATAAKLCYSSSTIDTVYDGLTPDQIEKFLTLLADLGHESPIEHCSFTFGIEGVSRALLAQITRHRIASFSVQSQRYVKENNFDFVVPPAIKEDKQLLSVFSDCMNHAIDGYNKLADILTEKYVLEYIKDGMDEKKARTTASKKAIEDARFVLPNACDTQMMVTFNARSLLNFFKHRCCNRAQWEIKAVADQMLKLVIEVAPSIFSKAGPACRFKPCPEGKMTCGQMNNVRQYYTDFLS